MNINSNLIFKIYKQFKIIDYFNQLDKKYYIFFYTSSFDSKISVNLRKLRKSINISIFSINRNILYKSISSKNNNLYYIKFLLKINKGCLVSTFDDFKTFSIFINKLAKIDNIELLGGLINNVYWSNLDLKNFLVEDISSLDKLNVFKFESFYQKSLINILILPKLFYKLSNLNN